MTSRIQIASAAAVTPLGLTLEETWSALLAGRFIDSTGRVPLPAGAADAAEAGGCRLTRLGSLAAQQAIEAAADLPADAALLVGTSKGPVDRWLGGMQPVAGLPFIDVTGLASLADALARRFGLTGPRLTLSSACSSGLYALIRAAMLLGSGEADAALVVAAESSLHPIFEASFARLGVLAPARHGCRPFDQARAGFLISEAAAAVVLRRAGPSGTVFLDRYALGADATHLTAPDPRSRTLRRLLARVLGDDGGGVDLVHAHGTATELNDPAELSAIDDALAGQDRPAAALYSHKGALGHSLGAAGLLSVAINVMAHRQGIVPPNVRTTAPLAARHLSISPGPQRRPVARSLALAAGFGGPLAAVTLVS